VQIDVHILDERLDILRALSTSGERDIVVSLEKVKSQSGSLTFSSHPYAITG